MSLRKLIYDQYFPSKTARGVLSPLNKLIVALIVIAIAAVVLETEPTIYQPHRILFTVLDLSLGVLFSLEYLSRLWSVGENPRYAGFSGRVRYMLRPLALIDLITTVPFFFPMVCNDLFLLRLARLLRILALGKFGRYSRALQEFVQVLRNRSHELIVSLFLVLITILVASSCMYLIEGSEQPETFGSIPRALWWGVVTLTTLGYGDVYPKTLLGKLFCGVSLVAGIGLIAFPTGILAAAFSEVFMRSRTDKDAAQK